MSSLQGKTALVTGASRGIGKAIAQTLAGAGAKVVIAARKQEPLDAAAKEIAAAGAEVLPIACHMGQPEQIQKLLEAAKARFGGVDLLVNNAATNPYFGPMMNLEWPAWDKTFEVNLKGYFAMTRAVVEQLIARDAPGAVVNITSIMGMRAAPFQGIYGMTKAAVISMTQTLAAELSQHKIRVNAIAPGLIETKFSASLIESQMISKPLIDRTPLARIGQPEEIGGAALFLLSDASAFMTGQTIVIDGGMTIN